jgi:transposase
MNLAQMTREELIQIILDLKKHLEDLNARNKELERRLALNSKNSNKPPSTDGLKKSTVLRIQNNREKTNRLSGGQKNHQGETLQQSSHPDKVIQHTPEICSACRANLVRFSSLI